MGNRDDNSIDEHQADALLRRALEPDAVPMPASPQLIARTLDRLPPGPPAQAQRHLAARRQSRRIAAAVVLVPLVLVALFNIWSITVHGPQMAFLFGDGRSGFSGAMLALHLVAKPLWNTVRAVNGTLVIGSLVAVGIALVVLRQLVRRIQHQHEDDSI